MKTPIERESPDGRPGKRPGPSHRRRGPRLTGLIGAVVVLVAICGYAGWWWFLAKGLTDGIEGWQAQRQDNGIAASWSGIRTSGFPGDIVVTLDNPKIALPSRWRWQAASLTLAVSPISFDTVRLSTPGRHTIVLTDARSDGAAPVTWTVDADDVSGRLSTVGGMRRVEVDVDNASLTRDGAPSGKLGRMTVSAAQPVNPAPADPEALKPPLAYDLAFDMRFIGLDDAIRRAGEQAGSQAPALAALDLGTVDLAGHVRIDGDLAMPVTRTGLAAWRNVGGVIDLPTFSVAAGDLKVTGNGSVSLDNALQPIGALTFKIGGYETVVDKLVTNGRIASRDANMVKGLLKLLAGNSGGADAGGTGGNTISAAISVQNRKIFLGPFELGQVPLVRWPEAP